MFGRKDSYNSKTAKQIRIDSKVSRRLENAAQDSRGKSNSAIVSALAGGLVDFLEPLAIALSNHLEISRSEAFEIALKELDSMSVQVLEILLGNALKRQGMIGLCSSSANSLPPAPVLIEASKDSAVEEQKQEEDEDDLSLEMADF